MSNLRRIMQKLGKNQQNVTTRSPRPTVTPGEEDNVGTLSMTWYQKQLDECTSVMLQYEWTWFEEHINGLELCLNQLGMLEAAGGQSHIEALLSKSRICQEVLKREMKRRGVEPACPSHAVVPGDHAWEVSQESIKKKWGW
jgi:hypothetical protein